MAYDKSIWMTECQHCGRTQIREERNGQTPPSRPPVVSGKCSSSPNGTHAPKWVKIG